MFETLEAVRDGSGDARANPRTPGVTGYMQVRLMSAQVHHGMQARNQNLCLQRHPKCKSLSSTSMPRVGGWGQATQNHMVLRLAWLGWGRVVAGVAGDGRTRALRLWSRCNVAVGPHRLSPTRTGGSTQVVASPSSDGGEVSFQPRASWREERGGRGSAIWPGSG